MSNLNVEEELWLLESLVETLRHPECARVSWMNSERLRHLTLTDKDDSFYWVDTEGGMFNIAFPAILDMEGGFGRSEPYFSLRDCKSVSFLSFIFYFMKCF